MSEVKGEIRERRETAEQEVRRRAALAQIRQYGDPVLRLAAHEVESFDADLAQLVARMKHLMIEASGVGLAANQVGILRRVILFALNQDEEPIALVNPRITRRADATAIDDEGCLSLQGAVCPVERSVGVSVEARDPEGKEIRLELEELAARVAQHELDHLDGMLILDRTTPEARREALAVLRPRLVLGASA
jgi:peptide deformylase